VTGFAKLFSSILTSSIWVEDDSTLRVWIALLALSDSRGKAEGAVPGLASLCRMSVEDTETALARLAGPDQYSRSPEFEGRRIAPIEGGWQILNYLKYREKGQAKPGSRAEYMRTRRRSKGGQFTTSGNDLLHVTPRDNEVLHVPQKQKQKQITETNVVGLKAVRDISTSKPKTLSVEQARPLAVFDHWKQVMGKPRAKLDAKRSKAIAARLADGYDVEALCRAIDGCKASSWHMGVNDRGTRFDDLELICRDAAHVDRFLTIAAEGDPMPMSPTMAHNARTLGLLETDAPPALPAPPSKKPEDES
jgi:hypothetical protein